MGWLKIVICYQFTSPVLFAGVLILVLMALRFLPRAKIGRLLPGLALAGLIFPVAATFLLNTALQSATLWESIFPPLGMEPLLALYALLALGSLALLASRGDEPARAYSIMVLFGLAAYIGGTAFSPTVRAQSTSRSLITFFPLLAWLVVDGLRRLRAPENHRVTRGVALACVLLLAYHMGASDFDIAYSMDTEARAESQVLPAFTHLNLTGRYLYSINAVTNTELLYMRKQTVEEQSIHNIGLAHTAFRMTRDQGLATREGVHQDKYEVLPVDYIYYERRQMEAPAGACLALVGDYRNWYGMLFPEYQANGFGCFESPLNQSLRENATVVKEAALSHLQVPRWVEDIPYRVRWGLPLAPEFTYRVGIYWNQSNGPPEGPLGA